MAARFAAAVLIIALATVPGLAATFPTLPDHKLTPGKANTSLSVTKICSTKWGQDARAVTDKMKKDVIKAYHFSTSVCPVTTFRGKRIPRVEIDHLISRDIGGADVVENLWPQCYEPVNKDKSKQANGAHKKDRLEVELNKRICKAKSAALLRTYQRKIRQNWISLYHQIYGDE
jgi:5-methylcytosine-specific restriction endonuclease McrA